MMKKSQNKIIIAAAGSGKTTHIVETALLNHSSKILITTFTDKNTDEIKSKFYELNGCIPQNIEILPWFTFLLSNCVRPYQLKSYQKRIEGIDLVNGKSARGTAKYNTAKYYFDKSGRVYSDKISEFALRCNEENDGMVLHRLSLIYDAIYIDEVQDLAGWDLELLKSLFSSHIDTLCVGDPRQGTLRTNNSAKNKNKSQTNLLSYLKSIQQNYHLEIDDYSLTINHRSVKAICDFSNLIFSSEAWPSTTSDFSPSEIEHLGLFLVNKTDVDEYLSRYNPMQLRYNITTHINPSYKAINFKLSKGATYNRTLLYPTKKILDWIFDNKKLASDTQCAFYVAVTRARYSVAIVIDDKYLNCQCDIPLWNSESNKL